MTARRAMLLGLATLLPIATWPADLDPRALIAKLAKPAPANVAFVEVRFSPLLKEPVVVSGELGYQGPTSLDRRVTAPYQEETQIRGESVTVKRAGEPERSFALKRAPELRALLGSFAAMLAGDPGAVEQTFKMTTAGSEANWQLNLVPIDARTRKRLQRIAIDGANTVPRCFSLTSGEGATGIMLLGDVAQAKLPQPLTREALQKVCGTQTTS